MNVLPRRHWSSTIFFPCNTCLPQRGRKENERENERVGDTKAMQSRFTLRRFSYVPETLPSTVALSAIAQKLPFVTAFCLKSDNPRAKHSDKRTISGSRMEWRERFRDRKKLTWLPRNLASRESKMDVLAGFVEIALDTRSAVLKYGWN